MFRSPKLKMKTNLLSLFLMVTLMFGYSEAKDQRDYEKSGYAKPNLIEINRNYAIKFEVDGYQSKDQEGQYSFSGLIPKGYQANFDYSSRPTHDFFKIIVKEIDGTDVNFSSIIKKVANGQSITQFAHLKTAYKQPLNLANYLGKLFFNRDSKYLNSEGQMKCNPGEVVLDSTAEIKCLLLMRFDKVKNNNTLFNNPQVILPYSQENIFKDDKTHIYRLVEVNKTIEENQNNLQSIADDSNGFRNILREYNLTRVFENGNLSISLTRRAPESDIRFYENGSVITKYVEENTAEAVDQPEKKENTAEAVEQPEKKFDPRLIIATALGVAVVLCIALATILIAVKKRSKKSEHFGTMNQYEALEAEN